MGTEYASSIIETPRSGRYLLQLRDYNAINCPGVFALLGGGVRNREKPEHAMERELMEETNLHAIASCSELTALERRDYEWKKDFEGVLKTILKAYPRIPYLFNPKGSFGDEELYRMLSEGLDHSFLYRIKQGTLEKMELKEGKMARLYTPEECMALVIAANDRLQLLHYFAGSGIKI